ncbi:hypothetical protein PBOR_01620 [Paenibacillus borealis]|uniref:Uncharacterized protein n=1 Tax=Paenibacillus borealis TaxID=160799 RepID=A0A089L9H6_PAEBO|nr:hypothetical protein PBOR_01620 [Paenibacillus borealis]
MSLRLLILGLIRLHNGMQMVGELKPLPGPNRLKQMPFLVQLTLLIIIVVQVILSSMLQFILMKAIFHQVLLKSLQM